MNGKAIVVNGNAISINRNSKMVNENANFIQDADFSCNSTNGLTGHRPKVFVRFGWRIGI